MRKTQTAGVGLERDLIDRLHKSLRVSGHTPQSLATVLGIHPNTIRNYLSGRSHPSRPVLIAWALAVNHGITADWLEHDAEAVGPNPPTGRQGARGPTRVGKLRSKARARKTWHRRGSSSYADEVAA